VHRESSPQRPAGESALSPVTSLLRILWAAPCTAVGLCLGAVAVLAGGSARRIGRTIEFAVGRDECPPGPAWRRSLPFSAITFGHAIIGTNPDALDRLRAHERVHVRQYEVLGPLFLLAYPAASLYAWLSGRRPYLDNHFEIAARGRK
jgi:hypothetical protein